MKHIDSLLEQIEISDAKEEETIPSHFVEYAPMKKKSSNIELASTKGVIKKTKKRSLIKTAYEFLALDVWNQLLARYSSINDFDFRAPIPYGINLEGDDPVLLMEFLPGYELKFINTLKRTTPVQMSHQKQPLPIHPACVLHLGALNQLKEEEGLYHEDFDVRHVKFDFANGSFIGVLDVENSREDTIEVVKEESDYIITEFINSTSASEKDLQALKSWYQEGHNGLTSFPHRQLPEVVREVEKKYGIELDFINQKINGVHISGRKY